MNTECYPISTLPGTTALFRDYAEQTTSAHTALLRRWYPADPFTMEWATRYPAAGADAKQADALAGSAGRRARLADALQGQATALGAGPAVLANIERLRQGASAVITGQQVVLFGGPLLTLLKAATAIRKAQDATAASGREHVPVFWLASEDHDLDEVDQAALLGKAGVEVLSLNLRAEAPLPVGELRVDGGSPEGQAQLEAVLDQASELLGWAPVCDLLRECYAPAAGTPGVTLASAFAKLLTGIFAAQGLIVMDACTREFHALGASTLRAALEHAADLEKVLLERSEELVSAGYHAQVLVTPGHSLLFLRDAETGARLPLRRGARNGEEEQWKAGSKGFTTQQLLEVLESEPERLSPNALLRPVFQDTILPAAAYVGGPAEIAYFAQCAPLYERILGRVTPILPRLSATLVEPKIAQTMAAHEVQFPQVLEARTIEALALRLGARAMPIEGKRKLAAAGQAMDAELNALTEYMTAMSADLGRTAGVSASKMRYQMDRLRRVAAGFELQKEASLRKHAAAIMLALLPEGHLQERLLAGVWFLARNGEQLAELLVENAGQECPGHRVIFL